MSWQTIYLHYDEDALAVFANMGLLRRARKDVDNGKITLIDPQGGIFNSDGQQVVLDAQGIQKAQCDCPASDCCKHILATVLWLQANSTGQASEKELIHETMSQSSESLLSELLSFSPEELIKLTGKANCRLAIRLLQQWEQDQKQIRTEDIDSQLKIYLPEFEEPIIFLKKSGYKGMLSSLPENQRKALHLAAVVKLFKQSQKPWTWPDELNVIPSEKQPLSEDEKNLIAIVNQFIQELLRQGLSHISRSSATQLHLLNISAKAEGLPLLASYLRGLSGQVKLLADKHFTMDEGKVLHFLAQLSAYLYQLTHAAPDQLMKLRGIPRKQYDEKNTTLSLIPVSADWWTTNSGALGATFTFWNDEEKQLLQSTQARANRHDPHFNCHGVWSTLSVWKQTADKLMRRPFILHFPRISDEGKLATSGDSYATSQNTPFNLKQYQSLRTHFGIQDWNELPDYFSLQTDDFFSPLLLHIETYQPLVWYEIEQCIIWEVNDSKGNSAFLRLYWEDAIHNHIEELRYITKKELEIIGVSVQPVRREQRIDLIPTTLWLKKGDDITLFYLDFDFHPRKKQRSAFISHIQEYMAKKKRQNAAHYSEPTLSQKLCRPILSILEAQACTGRQSLSISQKEQLDLSRQTAEDLGMDLLAHCLQDYLILNKQNAAESLLRLTWLCHQLQQLQSQLPIQLR
ncbi:SWIM zinc finger family protein [Xenorhabdus bharatensis]|uniref:SWIM zinc finger family protein n=1 Tax=Xenorhabdus bharatensis TaxID=3136256 RepID=UPI0030F46525